MLQIPNFSKLKRTIVWMLFGIMGYANVCAQSQDTLYITSTSALVQLQWRTNVKNILVTNINCDTLVAYGQGTQIVFKDAQAEVQRFLISSFIFKINGSVVTGSANIYNAVNALNTGELKKMLLIRTIRIVSALPATIEPNTTYYVGAQAFVEFTGLNGNVDETYTIKGRPIFEVVGAGTGERGIEMLINGITTVGAYQSYLTQIGNGTSVGSSSSNTGLLVGRGFLNGVGSYFQVDMYSVAQGGVILRDVFSQFASMRLTTGNSGISTGQWKDATTNLTSIRFRDSSVTYNLIAGTVIELYAKR
jgi:hypothetical protein